MHFRKALLITYPIEELINEALSLADAAGYIVKKIVTQKHIKQSRYGIGRGKAYEVKDLVNELDVDVILFDEVLKPTQQYNLASLCKKDIIDRELLILEIFEYRASTSESRIQIKLAQLRYEMVRVKEKVKLAKIGEQPGFFGLGKYDADVYTLALKSQMSILKKKLQKEEKRRTLFRNQRNRTGISTISLIGYTSAGKTTLFNLLTGESKAVGKEMFTTLSTFTRSLSVNPNQKVLLSDTVGFVNKLPAYMIDAFKSTLNELVYSQLILLVIDISQSIKNIKIKLDSCLRIINELQIPLTKVLYLLNKVDLTTVDNAYEKSKMLGLKYPAEIVLPISAKTGYNTNKILEVIDMLIYGNNIKIQHHDNFQI
jgi:GTP-binding protein HflX